MLKYRDTVIFDLGNEKLEYVVLDTIAYIVSFLALPNDTIFTKLGLNKKLFCDIHYGYVAGDGDWPETSKPDIAAINRVIDALQEECRKFREKKKEYSYNIGDIVTFTIGKEEIAYKVTTTYLAIKNSVYCSDYIFQKLSINKWEICELAYGYPSTCNSVVFPTYQENDMGAANRIIQKLQFLCKNYSRLHNVFPIASTSSSYKLEVENLPRNRRPRKEIKIETYSFNFKK